MGLDTVELVMAWEEGFGVDIPNEVAATMATSNHAIDYLCFRLGAPRAGTCRTRRAFRRVRAALEEGLGIPRRSIRPRARLTDILPAGLPDERWRAVGGRVGQGWPAVSVEDPVLALLDAIGIVRPPRLYPGRNTVGDLVRNVAAHEPDVRPAPGQRWTRERVALYLRRITIEELGIEYFRDDDEFARDLGVD